MAYIEHSENKFQVIEDEFCNLHGKVDSLSGKLDQQVKKHDQLKNQSVSLDMFKELGEKFESYRLATDEKIRAKRFHFTIDGLSETKGTTVKDLVLNRCNEDAQTTLQSNDLKKVYRIGKPRPKSNTKPCPIKIELADDNARDQILSCRGKLKNPDNASSIWINEDLPDSYRRRKVMLRDLVKHITATSDHSEKARFHNLSYTARQIITNNDPYTCKQLGEEFTPAETWRDQEESIMYEIVKCKFLQNEHIKSLVTSNCRRAPNRSHYWQILGSWSKHTIKNYQGRYLMALFYWESTT